MTSDLWGAVKKGAAWTGGKLKKGADFVDEQWRTKIRPAVTKTIGQDMMDNIAHKAGSFVENSVGGVGTTLKIASKVLEFLPRVGKLKDWTRKGGDYLDKAGDTVRNYVSLGYVDRTKTKTAKKQTANTLKDIFDGKDVPNKNISAHTRVTKAKSGRMRLSRANQPSGFLGSVYDLTDGWVNNDSKFGTPSVYGSNRG